MTMTCKFCERPADDWCPACMSLMCPHHAAWHLGSFDEPCRQGGPAVPDDRVEAWRTMTADELDSAGVAKGHLGLTCQGQLSVHRCTTCGRVFTVSGPPSIEWGNGCLADDCGSYDIARDADMFFEPAFEAGIIRRRPKE